MADFLEIQTQTGWGRTLHRFADWCHPQTGWRVLDVGCGPGLLPSLFARRGCLAFGVDLDAGIVHSPRLHHEICLGNAGCLPFASQSFHLVTASNLLFLMQAPESALWEMARLTRPGGWVCVLDPSERLTVASAQSLAEQRRLTGLARASLINWATLAESHRRWDEAELKALFAGAGLELRETGTLVGAGLARMGRGTRREDLH
ncbi:MAG: methyltransferase domain-containing protein [Anaerolineales bacterium]|nr:methyltransferase domain-containing protein [Anaerolineales bacterium]